MYNNYIIIFWTFTIEVDKITHIFRWERNYFFFKLLILESFHT